MPPPSAEVLSESPQKHWSPSGNRDAVERARVSGKGGRGRVSDGQQNRGKRIQGTYTQHPRTRSPWTCTSRLKRVRRRRERRCETRVRFSSKERARNKRAGVRRLCSDILQRSGVIDDEEKAVRTGEEEEGGRQERNEYRANGERKRTRTNSSLGGDRRPCYPRRILERCIR